MAEEQEKNVLIDTILSDSATRYFMVKSFSNDNIGRSLQHGIWATGPRNERVLLAAFVSSPHVILIFSVNSSSRFSGFALMTTKPGEQMSNHRNIFTGPDGKPFPGRVFGVKWLRHHEVFFRDSEHIANRLNEGKPVKIGRDGQELDAEAGKPLCGLIERSYQTRLSRPSDHSPSDSGGGHHHHNNGSGGYPSHMGKRSAMAHWIPVQNNKRDGNKVGDDRDRYVKRIKIDGEPGNESDVVKSEGYGSATGIGGRIGALSTASLAQLANLAAKLKVTLSAQQQQQQQKEDAVSNNKDSDLNAPRSDDGSGHTSIAIPSVDQEGASGRDACCNEERAAALRSAVRNRPGLAVFPLDLTNLSYELYQQLHHQASNEAKQGGDAWAPFPVDTWLSCQREVLGSSYNEHNNEHNKTAERESKPCCIEIGSLLSWLRQQNVFEGGVGDVPVLQSQKTAAVQ
eukprot:Lankesteria_metandrocarpae@DN8089_c0_g1_i1.p1